MAPDPSPIPPPAWTPSPMVDTVPPKRRPSPLLVGVASIALLGACATGAIGTVGATVLLSRLANPAVATTQATSLALDTAAIYQKALPSVVQVNVRSTRGSGMGSGFVVDTSGRILTNAHVVSGANQVSVRFSSGTEVTAQVVARDTANDLAVLQATLPAGVPALPLGDSGQVRPGQSVIAIGSPLGLGYSVTSGIVSATNRSAGAAGGPRIQGLIQIDAAINPGNSGGPLLNAAGEVIGINTLGSANSTGIGFAVSSNAARELLRGT